MAAEYQTFKKTFLTARTEDMMSLNLYLSVLKFIPVGGDVEIDSTLGSVQSDVTDEENYENDVGKCCSDVHHLKK